MAATLGGCRSSQDGLASKSATQILTAAKGAAEAAGSVTVSSVLAHGRLASTIDAQLAGSRGARGRMSLFGRSAEVIVIGDAAYVKGDALLERELLGAGAARVPPGAWLKGSATAGPLAGLVSGFSQRRLLEEIVNGGTFTKGQTITIAGQPAVELNETGRKLFTSRLYIAATGEPYPIRVVRQGRINGTTTFSAWNRPVALTAPANAVDVSRLTRDQRR